jgi:hypothetical protein
MRAVSAAETPAAAIKSSSTTEKTSAFFQVIQDDPSFLQTLRFTAV